MKRGCGPAFKMLGSTPYKQDGIPDPDPPEIETPEPESTPEPVELDTPSATPDSEIPDTIRAVNRDDERFSSDVKEESDEEIALRKQKEIAIREQYQKEEDDAYERKLEEERKKEEQQKLLQDLVEKNPEAYSEGGYMTNQPDSGTVDNPKHVQQARALAMSNPVGATLEGGRVIASGLTGIGQDSTGRDRRLTAWWNEREKRKQEEGSDDFDDRLFAQGQ